MDIKDIANNFDKMKIGIDEPFKFHCTKCGECCMNRDDIILSPKDLYDISKELGLPMEAIIKQYCELYIGQSSHIFIIRLLPIGQNKQCPFLRQSKCSIHKSKPTVCAMYPIGRAIQVDANGKYLNNVRSSPIDYVFMNPDCGNKSTTHTVRDWFGSFGIPLDDKYFLKWHSIIILISNTLMKLEKKEDIDAVNQIRKIVFGLLYLNYNMESEFEQQFLKNTEMIEKLIKEIENTSGN